MNTIVRFASCAAVVAALAFPATAQATVIGFEDLSNGYVPTSYQGLTWSGGQGSFSWVLDDASNGIGFEGTVTHSGDKYTWSNGGTSLTIEGGPFDLNSLWLRVGYSAQSGLTTMIGYNGGTQVYSSVVNLTSTYDLYQINFSNITAFAIINGGANVLVDDITINAAAAVPGPVVGAGLPGLVMAFGGFLAWRRRKAAIAA